VGKWEPVLYRDPSARGLTVPKISRKVPLLEEKEGSEEDIHNSLDACGKIRKACDIAATPEEKHQVIPLTHVADIDSCF
jgi:hypothetical protein